MSVVYRIRHNSSERYADHGRRDDLPIIGCRAAAGSATMRADFDLPESPFMSACQTPIIVALDFPPVTPH
jgi:orotidine-5'-phosphate decarboxylase